ncbi:MAG: hypothetical protein PF487_06750, partial [Bacteroidales bacterium]|nr:hypothetical protein [Bacteroidales bacterium]
MILIADSGSSKIDWRAIKNNIIVKSFTTSGLNPYFVTSTLLEDIKREILEEINIEDIRIVNFYCAGCLYEKNKINISEILNGIFKNADINVETDLLAAARALYNKEKGIVVVLGTGANTCLYDGDKIINNIPSLGYFFGDEGGGDYLGKLLISDYLKDKMPLDILKKFEKEYDIN